MLRRRSIISPAWMALAALVGLGLAGPARADVINAGFETGDLTGWTANDASKAAVVGAAFDFRRNPIMPSAGGFQMQLVAGLGTDVASTLTQTFSVTNFDMISFDVAFAAHDVLPFNDSAYFKLDGEVLGQISIQDVGDLNSSGYLTVQVPISEGDHTLEFGILNGVDNNSSSYLYVDNILLTDSGDPGGGGPGGGGPGNENPSLTPEPGSLALLGLGLAGLAGYGIRRRKTATL